MSRVLLGDVGGTYARFAISTGQRVGEIWATEVGAHHDVVEALRSFARAGNSLQGIDGALIAAAGPVEGGRCLLTNASWVIDEKAIGNAFGLRWMKVVNDLEAVAAGLPELTPANLKSIGGGASLPRAPMAIVSPGTGLGVGCLVHGPAGPAVLASEGGHATMAGLGDEHDRLISFLRRKYDHVSAERVLSGSGLSDLHQYFAAACHESDLRLPPSEVTARAFDNSSAACQSAVDMFCDLLGVFAGEVALMLGARGGVFIGGGIAPRFADRLASSRFRRNFESKGRMRDYLKRIETKLVLHPSPAFVGLQKLVPAAST